MQRTLATGLSLLVLLVASACGTIQVRKTTNVLDDLYPQGSPAIPAQDVTLTLPLRVGLAFAPEPELIRGAWTTPSMDSPVSETQKQQLLERIADAFRGRDAIGSVQAIPSTYLKAGGSFDNLDQISRALGIDIIVLLSYDQAQFSETGGGWSLTYLTLVGAYVVEGENNQTQTFLDAAVLDISSRALLFRAAGTDVRGGTATPAETPLLLRTERESGFVAATEDLIAKLDTALQAFGRQAVDGTIRGMGTPALEVKPSADDEGVARFENGHDVGALGAVELALLGLLTAAAWLGRRAA